MPAGGQARAASAARAPPSVAPLASRRAPASRCLALVECARPQVSCLQVFKHQGDPWRGSHTTPAHGSERLVTAAAATCAALAGAARVRQWCSARATVLKNMLLHWVRQWCGQRDLPIARNRTRRPSASAAARRAPLAARPGARAPAHPPAFACAASLASTPHRRRAQVGGAAPASAPRNRPGRWRPPQCPGQQQPCPAQRAGADGSRRPGAAARGDGAAAAAAAVAAVVAAVQRRPCCRRSRQQAATSCCAAWRPTTARPWRASWSRRSGRRTAGAWGGATSTRRPWSQTRWRCCAAWPTSLPCPGAATRRRAALQGGQGGQGGAAAGCDCTHEQSWQGARAGCACTLTADGASGSLVPPPAQAERCRIAVGREEQLAGAADDPGQLDGVMAVQCKGNFMFDPATHRDFLGACLGTGIERSKARCVVLLCAGAAAPLAPAPAAACRPLPPSHLPALWHWWPPIASAGWRHHSDRGAGRPNPVRPDAGGAPRDGPDAGGVRAVASLARAQHAGHTRSPRCALEAAPPAHALPASPQVRTVPVQTRAVALSELQVRAPRVEELSSCESSLRLDAVASAGFRLSRGKMSDLIKSGRHLGEGCAVRQQWPPRLRARGTSGCRQPPNATASNRARAPPPLAPGDVRVNWRSGAKPSADVKAGARVRQGCWVAAGGMMRSGCPCRSLNHPSPPRPFPL